MWCGTTTCVHHRPLLHTAESRAGTARHGTAQHNRQRAP